MDIQPYDHTKELFEEATGLTHDVIVYTITQLENELTGLQQLDKVVNSHYLEIIENLILSDPCCRRVLAYLALKHLTDKALEGSNRKDQQQEESKQEEKSE